MNTDTGQIYRGPEIDEAVGRGEPVVAVSEEVAQKVETGARVINRAERRRRMKQLGAFKPRVRTTGQE